MTYVYVVGIPENVTDQITLQHEAESHADIVQGDFMDTYANLSLKTVTGFKWASQYCR